MDKPQIVADIRAKVEAWRLKMMPELDLAQSCFYWAVLSQELLRQELGCRVLVSAGSAAFARVDLAQDDGKIDTHFGYVWRAGSPATAREVAAGRMPEMHIWCTIPERGELFDITTRYLKERCESHGMAWLARDPPDFVWCRPHELPEGWEYRPDLRAVQLVVRMVKTTWRI